MSRILSQPAGSRWERGLPWRAPARWLIEPEYRPLSGMRRMFLPAPSRLLGRCYTAAASIGYIRQQNT